MDLPAAAANLKTFKRKIRVAVLPISATAGTGLDALKRRLQETLRPVPRGVFLSAPPPPATDAPAASEAILTEEQIRRVGFLELPPKKSRRRPE